MLRILDIHGERIPENAMEASVSEACGRLRSDLARDMFAPHPTVLDERGNVAWSEPQAGDGLRRWIEYSDGVTPPTYVEVTG